MLSFADHLARANCSFKRLDSQEESRQRALSNSEFHFFANGQAVHADCWVVSRFPKPCRMMLICLTTESLSPLSHDRSISICLRLSPFFRGVWNSNTLYPSPPAFSSCRCFNQSDVAFSLYAKAFGCTCARAHDSALLLLRLLYASPTRSP